MLFPQQLLWDKDPSSPVPPLSQKPSSWQEGFSRGREGALPHRDARVLRAGGVTRLAARGLAGPGSASLHNIIYTALMQLSGGPSASSGLAVNHALRIP